MLAFFSVSVVTENPCKEFCMKLHFAWNWHGVPINTVLHCIALYCISLLTVYTMNGEQSDPIRAAAVDVPTPMFLWSRDRRIKSITSNCLLRIVLIGVYLATPTVNAASLPKVHSKEDAKLEKPCTRKCMGYHWQPKLTLRTRIMLRNSGHGENIRVCMGIFTIGFRR